MPIRFAFVGVLGILGIATAAGAAEDAAQPGHDRYIAIGGGKSWLEKNARLAKDGYGFEMLVGWQFARHWNVELNSTYFNFETGKTSTTDFYRSSLGLDLVWTSHSPGWRPFALIGAGAAYNDMALKSMDGVNFTANAGAGIASPPLGPYGMRLRAEVRMIYDHRWSEPQDWAGLLTVVIPLRRVAQPVVRVETRTVEVVREIVREVPAPPPPVAAPPPDSDRDGVDDAHDRCPDTLPGTRVDRDGCAVEEAVIVLQGVYFETGSDRLTHDSLSILIQAAAALRGQPSMKIEVRGHTDSVGRDENNLALSQRRAQSVVAFLVENGIPAARLTALGFGETRPVADNRTPEGRATNRRVEFRVLAR